MEIASSSGALAQVFSGAMIFSGWRTAALTGRSAKKYCIKSAASRARTMWGLAFIAVPVGGDVPVKSTVMVSSFFSIAMCATLRACSIPPIVSKK